MRDPNLRLNDLLTRGRRGRETTKLMNVKVPANVLERIDQVATNLGATKTEVVIAILNEGLTTAERELKHWKAPAKVTVPKDRRCANKGCDKERVAKGLCASCYQAARRAEGK